MPAPQHQWAAATYDASFDFVSGFGQSVVDLLDPQPGERILDLGCGTGVLAAAIAARGAIVEGVDADAAMIERAQALHPQLDLRIADAHDLHVDTPVDAVFSNAALHWMTRPQAVVRGVAQALRPGGRFVAELGGRGNLDIVMGAIRDAIAGEGIPHAEQAQPWFYPGPGEYEALLEQAGMEVRMMHFFPRPTPLTGGAAGLSAWLDMFATMLVAPLDAAARARVYQAVEATCRPHLWDAGQGQWVTDYQRLRFVAVRRAGT